MQVAIYKDLLSDQIRGMVKESNTGDAWHDALLGDGERLTDELNYTLNITNGYYFVKSYFQLACQG